MQGRKAGPSIITFIISIVFILATGVLPGCITPIRDLLIHNREFSSTVMDGKRIRVVNWNIEKKSSDLFWARDFNVIRETYSPDILILQEASLDPGLETVLAAGSLGWLLAPNLLNSGNRTYAGVLTASRTMPVVEQSIITDSVEPLSNTPKAALATEYAFPDRKERLLVVNVHAINFVELPKYESQLAKIEALLSAHRGPIILSGDFNTWNTARMRKLSELALRHDLLKVAFNTADTRTLTRFPFDRAFDHVYYRGLAVLPQSPDVLEKIRSSDHFPMIVDFTLAP